MSPMQAGGQIKWYNNDVPLIDYHLWKVVKIAMQFCLFNACGMFANVTPQF